MARTDKRSHIKNLASQAKDAANRGEQGRIYKITKPVSGRSFGYKVVWIQAVSIGDSSNM